MSTPTPADRQRAYRRARGIGPRQPADTPLARARRRRAAGTPRHELDPDELEALRGYEADVARRRRSSE
jgi:hypothetical protein